MRLLVSLCNKKESIKRKLLYPKVFLLEVDTETGKIKPIKIRFWIWKPKGVTGIARYREGFVFVVQAKKHRLFYVDKNYRVKKRWKLEKVKDAHSICVNDGKIYIASTGNDSIIEFSPETGKEKIFYREGDSKEDTIHINSLVWEKDKLIISAFGKKDGERWFSAKNGFLKNIHDGRIILDSLFHPHTLVKTEEGIFFCESAKKRVLSLDGSFILNIEKGYVRGLAIKEGEICVGISHARERSKSTGKKNDLSDPLIRSFQAGCGIMVFRKKGKKAEFLKFIDLYPYSNELYDLIPL